MHEVKRTGPDGTLCTLSIRKLLATLSVSMEADTYVPYQS